MLPMGWNQIRQSRVPVQQQRHDNNMAQQLPYNQQSNPAMNQQQANPGMMQQQQPNQVMNQQQQQPMMSHAQEPYGMYQHPYMQQQQMFQHQMMAAYQMTNPQMMVQQPALKPPEPLGSPPPSPLPPLPKDEPPPTPPTAEAKWWVAEMTKLPSAHYREELERLVSEKWFQNMNMHQQIECWQHKMKLMNAKNKGFSHTSGTSTSTTMVNSQSSFQKPPVSNPPLNTPSPLRKPGFQQSGDVDVDMKKAKQEEQNIQEQITTFERQYGEWRKQFDDWKNKHKAHPNKQQFAQYETQWMNWQEQMTQQKNDLDHNLKSIRDTIQELERKQSERQHNTFQGVISQGPNIRPPQGFHDNFQNQRFPAGQRGPHPQFDGPQQRATRPESNFDQNTVPRFSVPGGQNNQRFQSPTPRFNEPSSGSQQRHPRPVWQGQQGPRHNFNENQGQRLRFKKGGANFDSNVQSHKERFRNPMGPQRFRGEGPAMNQDAFLNEEENFDNNQFFDEEEEDFNNYNAPHRFPHNQFSKGMRGQRPGFRGRGGMLQRPPIRGQKNSNRMGTPNQRLLGPRGGFINSPQLRGKRPRFPGPRQRFPGPRGPMFQGGRPMRPHFHGQFNEEFHEGGFQDEYSWDEFNNDEAYPEDDANEFGNQESFPHDGHNKFEGRGTFPGGHGKESRNEGEVGERRDDFDKLGENFAADGGNGNSQSSSSKNIKKEIKEENDKDEEKDKGKEWNIDRSKLPLTFGVPEDKKFSNLSETFTMHDTKPKLKDQKGASVHKPEEKTLQEKKFPDDPANDYSHYMMDNFGENNEENYQRSPYHEFPAPRGRGRGRGTMTRGRGRGRGRGERFPLDFEHREGLAKPPHVLLSEEGRFNRDAARRFDSGDKFHANTQSHNLDSAYSSSHYPDNIPKPGLKDEATPSSSGTFNTEALLQKAKELSNLDIKNLLSAVKSLKDTKSTPETSNPIPVQTSVARERHVEEDYTMPEFPEEAFGRSGNQYDALARGLDPYDPISDPLRDPLMDDRLTEAELIAAGLDPVSLGLREEDLLIQEYLMDPLLQDPLSRDPYLEREMLLRSMQEREMAMRTAEIRRKHLAMPVAEQKFVETIDYSHGLGKSSGGDGEKMGLDPEGSRVYDRSYPMDREEMRGRYDREYMGRVPLSPGRDDRRKRSPDRRMGRGRVPQREELEQSRLVVVEEDVVRERESMERHRMSLDREKESVEQRKSNLDQSRNSKEREDERAKRERSLERLRKMERELLERERILSEREHRLKIPDRERKARYEDRMRERGDWKAEGVRSSNQREREFRGSPPQRRRFEERSREGYRERSPDYDRGRGRSPPWKKEARDRDRSPYKEEAKQRERDYTPRRGRGRDERRSPDYSKNRFNGKDRRRFSSPSGDPVRTGSPSGVSKPPAKMMKLVPVIVRVEDLLNDPARQRRPKRIVIILRGLPGSGKTHMAKLIRDAEASKGVTPRVLGLDDYFMVENEKFLKDPDTGRIGKKKVLEYEYDAEMEPKYRDSLLRAFKKTLEDGYFNFVIVDSINDKVEYFSEFWTIAKKASFEVYVAEIAADVHVCETRNDHKRELQEIQLLSDGWQETPGHMIRLDVRQMLQDSEIQEVEMGDVSDEESNIGGNQERLTIEQLAGVPQSKWELMEKNERLDKLDGIKKKKLTSSQQDMADFLSVTDDYVQRSSAPGKKRVRWADIAEKSTQRRLREVGFVVGNTDWSRMMDDSHADKALNRTKFI